MPVTGFVTAGELKLRIDILRPVGTVSPTGGVVEGTPEVFARSVPAAMESPTGAEALQAGGLTSVVSDVIRMRYLPGTQSWMQVRFESRLLQIQTVRDVDNLHIEHKLFCTEVQ